MSTTREITETKANSTGSVLKEPMPDSNLENIAENKSEFASYDEVSKAIKELDIEIMIKMRRRVALQLEANRFHNKTAKEAKKKNKRVNSDPDRKASGFDTLVQIPEKFLTFAMEGLHSGKFSEEKMKELQDLNLQPNTNIARSLVTKMAWDYIKINQLYEESENNNKRFIAADANIKLLFSMTADEKINFYNFQKYVSRLFPKTQNTDNVADLVEDAENDVEAPEEGEDEVVEEVVVVKVDAKSSKKTKGKNNSV